jgi:hypothetical protein
MAIVFQCTCGTPLRADADDASERVRCPTCHAVVAVPAGLRPAAQPSDTFQIESLRTCPGCKKQWPAGTVVCVDCGHDFRSGKRRRRTYQVRDSYVDLGCTILGTYTRYSVRRDTDDCRCLFIQSWFLWIPLGSVFIDLAGYDAVATGYEEPDEFENCQKFSLRLQGPRKACVPIWSGQQEERMHKLIDMLKDATRLVITRM